MDNQEVYKLIKEFFIEKIKVDDLEMDTPLREFGDFDSLLVVELILFLEETLNIEIPEEYYGMENFETIAKIINTVKHSENMEDEKIIS